METLVILDLFVLSKEVILYLLIINTTHTYSSVLLIHKTIIAVNQL